MRSFLVSLALLAPLVAGCVAPGLTTSSTDVPLVLADVPAGARVEPLEGGLKLVFDAVSFPFEETLTIPEGTTLVRATGIVSDELGVSVSLRHAETDRRRCNMAPLDAWDAPLVGRATCSGVTVVDRLPDQWIVRGASSATEGIVEVEFLTTPLDGILADLDLSQLSMREHELEATETLMVPSFDGTELFVQFTKPKGAGPWPAVLWSSPYDYPDRLGGDPSAWKYFVNDWAQRGYAVVTADVRGYGQSEGCVEVWSDNEQKDQKALVEWIAQQDWSDGNVGFYGQSYVATTPVAAAVQAPEALKAIIAVAPVNNAYDDWHFGGVPNGENTLSPVGYQQIGGGVGETDPTALPYMATHADNGFCDPTLTARANDPRAVYDAFYEERNFSARAGDIRAAVLYTQGFEDSNVKSQMIPDFFNAITAPKLGLFGHWVHQHPTRADNEALMLLWLDQHVKGKPVGFDKLPPVRVVANDGRERAAAAWPDPAAEARLLHADPANGALAEEPATGESGILLDPVGSSAPLVGAPLPVPGMPAPTLLAMESAPLAAPLRLAGQASLDLSATLQHATNAHVAAYLYETTPEGGSRLVTWGMFNLAHRNGHDTYEPVAPGETVQVSLPLLPTEWTFGEGTVLRLEVRGATSGDWAFLEPTQPGALTVHAEGTALRLPLAADEGAPLPATAQR